MIYSEFIDSKKHDIGDYGFDPIWFPDMAFDFQREIVRRGLVSGRKGMFADTGLGKTLIQLSIAENIVRKTNKRVLILTPLAVAFQFIQEAEKIGTSDIEYSKDGKHKTKIVVTNYERLSKFDYTDFEAVILDESSILKNFDGRIKSDIMAFIRKVKYRFLSSATPSPNDYTELGNSSEALGYMGYMDMLGAFFKNNQNSNDSRSRNVGEKYYLKPHAEEDFFAWVNQWAVMVRKPSDLGFCDDRYLLPDLIENHHTVKNECAEGLGGQEMIAPKVAASFQELRLEQKQTAENRCEKAVHLASGQTSVYWCNTNAENDLLKSMDSEAVAIMGSMNIDKKEEVLLAFQRGEIKRLITKAKMTSMGLNWQHCNHTVFFPTYSYEQYYQSIRRFWRFGQTNNVTVDMVLSEGQKRMVEAINQKRDKAENLYQRLTDAVNKTYDERYSEFDKKVALPGFLK
jgi:hypothetical protein